MSHLPIYGGIRASHNGRRVLPWPSALNHDISEAVRHLVSSEPIDDKPTQADPQGEGQGRENGSVGGGEGVIDLSMDASVSSRNRRVARICEVATCRQHTQGAPWFAVRVIHKPLTVLVKRY
jgi:hypothetical protein